jgi:RNA polymerase sigma-70 factor (ECF subfamily)
MSADQSFDDLMARLRDGDQEAARRVFQRFVGRLIGLAYQRLDRRVRPKVGAEDVVQSALKSFLLGYAAGRFDPGDWDDLWGLLALITVRKCIREVKRYTGPVHDVGKESPGDGADGGWELLSREPTPLEAARLTELLGQLLGGLGERECKVVEFRLQGHTVPQVSALVGLTEFTVEGILKKVRKQLRNLRDDPGAD